jgi:hypothetical protein
VAGGKASLPISIRGPAVSTWHALMLIQPLVGMSVLSGHSLLNFRFRDGGDVHGQGSSRDSSQAAYSAPR